MSDWGIQLLGRFLRKFVSLVKWLEGKIRMKYNFEVECPACGKKLTPINTVRYRCENPYCHLIEVTAIVNVVYSEKKFESVVRMGKKEVVLEGKESKQETEK